MRVLLCHRLNLGDLVCASPGIQWLRQRDPQARFRLITNEFAAAVGELIPEVEQVYPYRKFDRQAEPEWRQLLRARMHADNSSPERNSRNAISRDSSRASSTTDR